MNIRMTSQSSDNTVYEGKKVRLCDKLQLVSWLEVKPVLRRRPRPPS